MSHQPVKVRVRAAIVIAAFFVLPANAWSQRTVPQSTTVLPSGTDSQSGLLVSVMGEDKKALDRQAVVGAIDKTKEGVVWRTTDRASETTFENLTPGATYEIEVSAVGYLTSKLDVKIPEVRTLYRVHVTLKKDPSAIELSAPSQQQMPVKARKEMSEGVDALKSGRLKTAEKHLVAADAMVPSNADVKFLLGYLALQQQNLRQAERYLTDSAALDAHNAQALTLLGRVQVEQKHYELARKALEQAVAASPDYWVAHSVLADTYLKLQEYEQAREEAQLAIDKGKGAGEAAEIALGQALENLGRNQEALKAYKAFIEQTPSSPLVPQVRNMYNDLARQISNPDINGVSKSHSNDILLAAGLPSLSTKSWGPPSIDDVKPVVAEGVACPFDKVVDGAGERVKELVDDLGRFNAIEDVVHEDLDPLDHPVKRATMKFNYVASISELQPGVFDVGEFRDQRSGAEDFPDHIATRGLPTLALIFHPDERSDFKLTCEGLGDWHGRATWLVRFQQREDRPHMTQEYKIAGQAYAVSLKGRAWISADTFHIVHLESDLVAPMPEIQLLSEHMAVEYAPVQFQKKDVELWLPKSAELYFDFRRHHYLRRHSFDHFMLFSVDSVEKRDESKLSQQEGRAKGNAPNR